MKRRLSLLLAVSGLFFGCVPQSATTQPAPAEPAPVETTTKFEAKPAEVGVGVEGQSLKDETGIGKIIAQPAMTLFQTKQKVVFEIQIPQAMELFKAGDGNGEYPKSHAEFMNKIIKANNIALPKLPEGQVYKYRPDVHQLWVEPKSE